MTIADNYVPLKQIGNGVTVNFSANWPMLDASYAQVFLQDAVTGVQTPVTQGPGANQYQIVLTASGWTVTFGTAPTSGQYVVVGRSTTRNQLTPYTTSQGFQGKNEEFSFDKVTAMLQEATNTFTRAIVTPLGDTSNLALPTAAGRASQYLAFDASGNVISTPGTGSPTPISTAMAPVVAASTVLAGFNLIAASGGAFGVSPTAPTPTAADSSTKVATTAFVNSTALTLAAGSTAVTQAKTDSSTKVATTSFANPSSTLATTAASVTLPGGMIIKVGTAPSIGPGGGGVFSVTYPVAFPNATVFAIFIVDANNATGNSVLLVTSKSPTGFSAVNTSGTTVNANWLAIGY